MSIGLHVRNLEAIRSEKEPTHLPSYHIRDDEVAARVLHSREIINVIIQSHPGKVREGF